LATGEGDGEGDTGRSMMLSGAVEDLRRALPWRGGGWSSPVTVSYPVDMSSSRACPWPVFVREAVRVARHLLPPAQTPRWP